MISIDIQIKNIDVQEVFDSYPSKIRKNLLRLRKIIYQVASKNDYIGELEESLKWGQASYRSINNTGTTIRLDVVKENPEQYAMYFHCKTTLVDTFKEIYRNEFMYEGNRALIFDCKKRLPVNALKECIEMALTYHISNK